MARSRTLLTPRVAPNGVTYLNFGCGTWYAPEWTNIDWIRADGVVRHDLRKPLPFADATFDVAYSSHVLEHLPPAAGAALLTEIRRVIKPGGVLRTVVPDLERIARDYLERLQAVLDDPADDAARKRLSWVKLELLDQMVRGRSGGDMIAAIRRGAVDPDDVIARTGDEMREVAEQARRGAPAPRGFGPRALYGRVVERRDPRKTGEAHRWMYDRADLRMLLESLGFGDVRAVAHDESRIPDWDRYHLDTSAHGPGPRKPESIFVEALR